MSREVLKRIKSNKTRHDTLDGTTIPAINNNVSSNTTNITKITNGTTTVDKANKDASGNVISTTYETKTDSNTHKSATNNPHSVTKSQVGLSNVNNYGISDSITSTSSTTYASSKAVKDAKDNAISTAASDATTKANAKVQNNLNASTTVAPSATAVNNALALKADASGLYDGSDAVKLSGDQSISGVKTFSDIVINDAAPTGTGIKTGGVAADGGTKLTTEDCVRDSITSLAQPKASISTIPSVIGVVNGVGVNSIKNFRIIAYDPGAFGVAIVYIYIHFETNFTTTNVGDTLFTINDNLTRPPSGSVFHLTELIDNQDVFTVRANSNGKIVLANYTGNSAGNLRLDTDYILQMSYMSGGNI